jgi:hypothetical protein
MTIFTNKELIKANIGGYPDWTPNQLFEACGLITQWVFEFDYLNRKGEIRFSDLKDYMTEAYGFGELYKLGGHVDPDTQAYISKYKEDEDLKPYLKMVLEGDAEVLIYPYGIVALPTPDGYFITRMD